MSTLSEIISDNTEKNEDVMDCTLRPLNCELNVLTRCDGSAMLTHGDTAVIAAVYGPVEVKLQNLHVDKSTVEVNFRPKAGQPSVSDRLKETEIKKTCEAALLLSLHPRSSINIIIQEMQNCGGIIATSINAACLALLNSGLSMKFLIAAMTCLIDEDGNVLLDSKNKLIREKPKATLTFVFESVHKNMVTSHTTGKFTYEQYQQGLQLCKLGSAEIFHFYRNIVTKYARTI